MHSMRTIFWKLPTTLQIRCRNLETMLLEKDFQQERERCQSAQAPMTSVSTQTDPTTTSVSVQLNPPIIPPSFTVTIPTQTEPLLPIISLSPKLPVSILKSLIPATTVSAPFNWADDAAAISIISTIPQKSPQDLSSLHSSTKNPFSSLCHRHHYSKHQKTVSPYQYTQPYPVRPPSHHFPPLTNLDWHRDPHLFELSRVLRTLGWSHP